MSMPGWVAEWVSDGRIVLLAVAVIAAEAALAALFLRRRIRLGSILLTMASGLALLGALHASLTGAGTAMVAAWLVTALAAHAADMTARFRSGRQG